MTNLLDSRFVVSGFIALLPPVLLLAVAAATGSVATWQVVLATGLGVALVLVASALAARSLRVKAQSFRAATEELRLRRRPSSLLMDEHRQLAAAEREFVSVCEALLVELQALAEQCNEFEAILRAIAEAVVVTNAEGEVMLLNDAARRIFELDPQADYRGRNLVEFCRDPAVQRFIASATTDRSANQAVASAEFQINLSKPRHLRATAALLPRGPHSRPWCVLVFYDMTQLKAYESLRTDFIANLTHEIRTPLSAIRGYAETLLRGVDDPPTQQRFLSIIERQSERLARLIDDLLELSDLERGLAPLRIQPLRPEKIVEEVVELVSEQAQRRGIELSVECEPSLPDLPGDRDRLHQVLLNLLDNALKYTPRGGKVKVLAHSDGTADNPGVRFVVSDTGEGIPPEHLPRLTERFYRVDRARSRELGGTGLGLAIVKHIVQLHHGKLAITSQVREGTTVTVWLPVKPAGRSEQS